MAADPNPVSNAPAAVGTSTTVPVAPGLDRSTGLDVPPPVAAPTSHQETLEDGTPLFIDADQSVYIIGADGSKTPAPDGPYTLKYGITMGVKDGKRID